MLPDLHERLRLQLLSLGACALIKIREVPDRPVSTSVTGRGQILNLSLSREDHILTTDAPDPLRFLLSLLEVRILRLLVETGGAKADVIGRRLDMVDGDDRASTKLRIILCQLVDRHVLTNDDGGYRLGDSFRSFFPSFRPVKS